MPPCLCIWHLQVLHCYLEQQVHPVHLHAGHLLQLAAAVASAAIALLRVRGLVAEPVIACPFLHVTARDAAASKCSGGGVISWAVFFGPLLHSDL